jgi:hypothetical protein
VERPGRLVRLEVAQLCSGEFRELLLLIGRGSGLGFAEKGEYSETRLDHSSLGLKLRYALDIYRAPSGVWLARREADLVVAPADARADAVDPANAQGFIHSLWPSQRGLACKGLHEANDQLGCVRAVVKMLRAST